MRLSRALSVMFARDYARMCAWSFGLTLILSAALTLGQCLRLRVLLWPPDPLSLDLLTEIITGGVLILAEAALPIAALVSALLVSARGARLNYSSALESLGRSSLYLVTPALCLGVTLSILSLRCAHIETPRALRASASAARSLARARSSLLIPQVIDQVLDKPLHPISDQVLDKPLHPISDKPLNPISDKSLHPISQSSTQSSRWLVSADHVTDHVTDSKETPSREMWLWSAQIDRSRVAPTHSLISARWLLSQEPGDDSLTMGDVRITGPTLQLDIGELNVSLGSFGLERALKTFGPPNSLDDDQLNMKSVHHRFIAAKRSALPLSAIALALLGACWGVQRRLLKAPITLAMRCLLSLGVTFGLLRQLELLARAGALPATWAAWLPCGLLSLWATLEWARLTRWGDHL